VKLVHVRDFQVKVGCKPSDKYEAIDGRYFVCSAGEINNFTALAKGIASARSIKRRVLPELELIEGVPGSGKTTDIVSKYMPNKGFLILCASKAATEETRERLYKKYPGAAEGTFDNKVRTIDSYIIHGGDKCKTLLVDEALMVHSGMLVACWVKSGCVRMEMYGDRKQIPFINRVKTMEVVHARLDYLRAGVKITNRTRSYRCPPDAVFALQEFYRTTGFVSVSEVRGKTISEVSIGSVADVPETAGVVYLTMTRLDKHTLVSKFRKGIVGGIMTVHEAQGKTFDRVALVRLSSSKGSIYTKPGHALVALSRHTKEFVYYVIRMDLAEDKVHNLVKIALQYCA